MSRLLSAFSPFWAVSALTTVLAFSSTTVATAATKFWKNSAGSGNWSNGANWSNVSAAGVDVVGAPEINDTVFVAPTDGATRTITYDASALLTGMTVDLTGAGTNRTTFDMSFGTNLNLVNGPLIGDFGRATFNHSAGTLLYSNVLADAVVGFHAGGNGIYNLSNTGSLSVARGLYIGAFGASTGEFNQTGGTVNVAADLIVGWMAGSDGTYTIGNSATLTSGAANIGSGGTGELNINSQSTVHINNGLIIGSQGLVNLNGGSLRFDQSAGSNRINFVSGTIRLAGDRDLNSDFPITTLFGPLLSPPASITIPSGKVLHVEGDARLIQPNRTVTVDGGRLISLNLNAGIVLNSAGTLLVNNGGTVTTSESAMLGDLNGSSGTATVSGAGSAWNIGGSLTVGNSGTGTLSIQDQAIVHIGSFLSINSVSTVTLQGGTLRFDSLSDPNDQVNFNSGTIQLAGNRGVGSDPVITRFYGAIPMIVTGKGLTIEGIATLSKPLTIAGGTFKANALVVGAGGALDFDRGVLELTGGAITGLTSLTVPTSGEFRANGVQSLRVTGAAGSTITASGNLTLGNAAAVNGFGTQGTLQVGANTVTLLDANDVFFDSLSLATLGSGASPGTVNAANGLTLDFGGNVTGFGTVSTPNLLAKPLINNGHITGNSAAQRITLSGYVKGVGTFDNVNFTGTFSPGLSPTILTVGNVALSATSTLIMELGGTAPGSGYDQIQSSGALAFDGTLQVSIINGFAPAAGQSFNLFDWASTSGTFDTLALPTLAGLAWNTSQLYATGIVSLTAVNVPGDYNQNGTVDAADYTLWRDNLGSSTALPNDDTAGVGPDDYTRWKTHFGQSAGSGATAGRSGLAAADLSSSAVPEPATLALHSLAAIGLLRFRLTTFSTRAIPSSHSLAGA